MMATGSGTHEVVLHHSYGHPHQHHRSSSYSSDSNAVNYDFESTESLIKWRGICKTSLAKIHRQRNPNLDIRDDALDYVQSLILKLLRILTSGKPNSLEDVQDRIRKTFPSPTDVKYLEKACNTIASLELPLKGGTIRKANVKKLASNSLLSFPILEFQSMLKEILAVKTARDVDIPMTVAIIAVIEHVADDVFKFTGEFVTILKQDFISQEDIDIAIKGGDKVLKDLFFPDDSTDEEPPPSSLLSRLSQPHALTSSASLDQGLMMGNINSTDGSFSTADPHLHPLSFSSDSQLLVDGVSHQSHIPSYEDVVKELIMSEKAFLRDVRLIIKVFRESFVELLRKESGCSSAANSLPSSPTSLTSPTSPSGQWSVPSSPTHKTGINSKISQADIEIIFSKISDVEENSVNLLCSLEDVLEAMSSSSEDAINSNERSPKSGIESIGACFEELACDCEFDVFLTFAQDVMTYRVSGASSSSINPSNANSSLIVISKSNERLNQLLNDPWIANTLSTGGQGFLPAVKYVLPKLLNGVVYHAFSYFDYISALKKSSPSEEDRDYFTQVEGSLLPLKTQLERMTNKRPAKFGQDYLRLSTLDSNKIRGITGKEVQALKKYLEKADSSLTSSINDFLYEGQVNKQSKTSWKMTKSYQVFLFDGVFLLCKPSVGKRSTSFVTIQSKDHHCRDHFAFTIKEKFFIRTIEVIDLPDTVIECCCTDHSCGENHPSGGSSTLDRSSHIHSNVMTQLQNQIRLISTSSWGTSTTSLASSLNSSVVSSVLGGSQGLASTTNLPPNIKLLNAFEVRVKDMPDTGIILCCPTLEEKITWMCLLVFLSNQSLLERRLETALAEEAKRNPLQTPNPKDYPFAQPDSDQNIILEEKSTGGAPLIRAATLVKLVERLTYHQYPDPAFARIFLTTYRSFCSPQELLDLLIKRFNVPPPENNNREDIKKFETDYVKPVQLRVVNVIRQWVEHHYYDFARDTELEGRMKSFLQESNTLKKNLKKFVDSILKTLETRRLFVNRLDDAPNVVFTFGKDPPDCEEWLERKFGKSLLTIHPIEFARQLTLYEFELFRRVKASELVLCAWTKKDKEKTSPNLLKMIHFNNNFIYYLEQQIVEAKNLEERAAIYSRIIEIMMVLKELNNLNGVLEIVSALKSSPVHRLTATQKHVNDKLIEALDVADKLASDHYKEYQTLLRSIDPPCVPFLGMYLTQIVHIQDGNPDDITVFLDQRSPGPSTGNSCCTSPAPSSGQQLSSPPSTCVSPCIMDAPIETNPKESLGSVSLINFSKRRKVAEITGEIQQYQNTPYCLRINKEIRNFIAGIDPLKDLQDVIRPQASNDSETSPITSWNKETTMKIESYFYDKSLEIEPRDPKVRPKFDRRWPDLPLKSPGIKPTNKQTFSTLTRSGNSSLGGNASSGTSTTTPSTVKSVDVRSQISPTPVVLQHHGRGGSNPGTPLSPTPLSGGSISDHCIFANVAIGGVSGGYSTGLPPMPLTPTTPAFAFPFPSCSTTSGYQEIVPPPLPPRTLPRFYRGLSCESDSSPPPLPPKGIVPSQKPLPPVGTCVAPASLVSPASSTTALSSSAQVMHPNHHPLHFPFQRNNSFSTSPGGLELAHHVRQTSQGSPSSHHGSPSGVRTIVPSIPSQSLRRNSAMDTNIALAPAPTSRRHSSTSSPMCLPVTHSVSPAAPPLHPPPPPPLIEGRGELPRLPPRTYKLSGLNSFNEKHSPE